jgi:uncharacterized protein (DUF488 family)
MKPQVLYTIGYQGVSVEVIIADLKQHDVKKLIDVRRNAISRINGFSKTELKRKCASAEIEYTHIPQLGIESNLRRALKNPEQYEELLDVYEKELLPQKESLVNELRTIVEKETCALLCFEASPEICHRGRLAKKLEEIANLRVTHLVPEWDLAST